MRILLALLLLIPFTSVLAQNEAVLKEAQKHFNNQEYAVALEEFKEVLKLDPTNANVQYKIGLCYINLKNDLPAAIAALEFAAQNITTGAYDEVSIKEKKAPVFANLELAKAYHLNYQFDEAVLTYDKFKAELGKDAEDIPLIDHYIAQCAYAKLLIANPVELIVSNFGPNINGKFKDFAPVLSADEKTLLYTSRRFGSTQDAATNKDTLMTDGNYYEDIYMSTKDVKGSWTTPKNLTTINSPWNEATIALSVDGQQVLFTSDREKVGSDKGKGNGDIYISKLNGDQWSTPEIFPYPINTKYQEPDACFNVDGSVLYFVSDRPGGLGGFDIYYVKRLPNGEWSYPENLGPKINSIYDDRAPFMHPDGVTLFFSSEGHQSMGGFDVFQAMQNEDGSWGDAENIGYPINTTGNDVCYVTSPDGKRAYYASYREEGYGSYDIYMISLPTPPEKQLTVFSGNLTLEGENSIVPNGAQIVVTDNETNQIVGIYKPNSKTGKYLFILPPGKNYNITYEAEGVLFKSENLIVPENSQFSTINNDIKLPAIKAGENIVLNNIFYEFDKDVLTPESKVELEKLTRLLLNNPGLKVELQGHTDSKGQDAYNMNLSQKRAEAVVKYLLAKGVNPDQMKAKGYGETQPIAKNENADGSDNPDGRKLNRRTVLKVISLDGETNFVNPIVVPDNLKNGGKKPATGKGKKKQ
jgi:outer membrane protein OmpA-like peptidoglycan-associated protein